MKKQLAQSIIGIAVGIIAFAIFKSVLEVVFSLLVLVLAYSFFKGMLSKKDENG